MERCTYQDGGKWRIRIGDTEHSGQWVDRLAAYEDTGLEPGDIKRVFNEDAVLNLAGQALGVTLARLRELAQADREGKVPKYTIGDTVYDSFGNAWEVTAVELHSMRTKNEWLYRCGHEGTDDYRALWYFEAFPSKEAALRREQVGGEG